MYRDTYVRVVPKLAKSNIYYSYETQNALLLNLDCIIYYTAIRKVIKKLIHNLIL